MAKVRLSNHVRRHPQRLAKTNEVQLVIGDDGKPKILLVSAPAEHEIAFIDWISFTFKRYTFMDDYIGLEENLINDVCILRMDQKLDEIFGFKVGKKRKTAKIFMNLAMK